ncbi:MAG: aryl-sulfate sulfotransferase [Anaerolineae bacterium]
MINRLTVWICLLMLVIPLNAQDTDTPAVGVLQSSDAVSEGYVLFSPVFDENVYLIDNDGHLINRWQTGSPLLSVYLLDNGDLLGTQVRPNSEINFPAGGTGRVVRYDWDNNLIWTYDLDLPYVQLHHDVALLPNGNILLSMWEILPPEQFSTYGFDPTTVPHGRPGLYFDNLIEVEPLSGEIVWRWRLLDHSVQDYDPTRPNYGVPAMNPHLIDINYSHRDPESANRTHINAIDYDSERGHILVSSHFHSEIWVIDHATQELIYRWGNPAVYGRGLPDSRQLFTQHDPTWLPDGNILIFSNGTEADAQYSTVLEIAPPYNPETGRYDLLDGAAYAPFEPIWTYDPEKPFFARNMSGAQRLPNGNTFITQAPDGRLFEVDSNGEIVWSYQNPFWVGGEETVTPTAIFRANRYLPDHPAFDGRTLQRGEELGFTLMDPRTP